MTIHQIKDRCWELQPPTDDERRSHFITEAAALEALEEDRENDEQPYAGTKPVQLDAPCWLVQCDGECEITLDTEGEGYVYHHDSLADAEDSVRVYEWRLSADGKQVFCEEDAPENAAPAPPSPAELEAAGQLRLPGVA